MKEKPIQYKELRVRVSEFDLDVIDAFCKITNQSKTNAVKQALKNYIYLNVENTERPNKKVLFSQNMLKPLLDSADESLIEEIAEISFQNGMSDSRLYYDVLNALRGTEEDLTIERRVEGLVEGVFSPEAQNWFEDIKFGWNGKILILGGKHNLGPKFSLFIKHLMVKYMKVYGYELQKEEFRENQLKENEKMIYTVILYFIP